jgi:hypothetical protein
VVTTITGSVLSSYDKVLGGWAGGGGGNHVKL